MSSMDFFKKDVIPPSNPLLDGQKVRIFENIFLVDGAKRCTALWFGKDGNTRKIANFFRCRI